MPRKNVKNWTHVEIDAGTLDDIKARISDALDHGRNCGGLRKSDSHAMRIRYLFEFWKQEVVYGAAEKRAVAKKLDAERKRQIIDDAVNNALEKL